MPALSPRYIRPAKNSYSKTVRDLANAINANYRTLLEYNARGELPKGKRGYSAHKVCDYFEEIAEQRAVDADEATSDELEALRRVKRQREELKLEQERGELVHVDEIREIMREMLSVWRSRAKTAGGRIAMRTAGGSIDDIKDAVDNEMWEIGREMDAWAEGREIATAEV